MKTSLICNKPRTDLLGRDSKMKERDICPDSDKKKKIYAQRMILPSTNSNERVIKNKQLKILHLYLESQPKSFLSV